MPREIQRLLNTCLDGAARTEFHAAGGSVPAFQVCGGAGFMLAVAASLALAWRTGLAEWAVLSLAAFGAMTFLALAMFVKVVTGVERLVYYHHEIAVVAASALLLRLLRLPLPPYLDIAVLGLGLFLGCGRIGCFMVGCCHGRPHRWGVRYTAGHARAGFSECYVGVRLLPLQALESLWVLVVTSIGIALVWRGARPGAAFGWYVAAYSLGRFAFEFLRGDADRPYAWGFSEAQWTSLILVSGVALAEAWAHAPYSRWHAAAGAGLVVAMTGVSLVRRFRVTRTDRLLHPRHLQEVAELVRAIGTAELPANPAVHVRRTSLGIQISGSSRQELDSRVRHYALSGLDDALLEGSALVLAALIARLDRAGGKPDELIRSNRGVFHFAIREVGERAYQSRRPRLPML